jgi:hypothetical protein
VIKGVEPSLETAKISAQNDTNAADVLRLAERTAGVHPRIKLPIFQKGFA